MESIQSKYCDISEPSTTDSKQRQLLEKVQQLYKAISQKKDPTQITALIKDFKYQVVLYFFQKEKRMLISHDTSYHDHRQAHDQFIWKVTDLQSEFTSKHHFQVLALCVELQKWINTFGSSMEESDFEQPFSVGNH